LIQIDNSFWEVALLELPNRPRGVLSNSRHPPQKTKSLNKGTSTAVMGAVRRHFKSLIPPPALGRGHQAKAGMAAYSAAEAHRLYKERIVPLTRHGVSGAHGRMGVDRG